MKEKKIKVTLDSNDDKYEYNGTSTINKDIIKFIDSKDTYIFDSSLERLTKTSKEKTLIIDFNKEHIRVIIDLKEINIPIKVKKRLNEINKKEYFYSVENNDKKFSIEIEV